MLAGFSQGGFVSGITAARSADVSRLILVYPALAIPYHARLGRMGGASYDPQHVPEELDCGNTVLGRHFHEEMAAMDPYLELMPYRGPVLILHGTEDRLIPCSYSIHLRDCYRPGQCHLQLIEKMGHGQNEAQEDSMIASMKEFLSGRTEVLTIHVIITGSERRKVTKPTEAEGVQTEAAEAAGKADGGSQSKLDIYFTGYCDTEYFHGIVMPDGCDHREYVGDTCTGVCARYELRGLDANGETCSLSVENRWDDAEKTWRPQIRTDSAALAWMNNVGLTAVLEDGNNGVVVRVFVDVTERKG